MKDNIQNSEKGDGLPLRQVLRAILDEGEQKVPPTTANIMAAIRDERQAMQNVEDDTSSDIHDMPPPITFPPVREIETPRPKRSRRGLYSVLAFTAVAAVLIASFGLFSFAIHNAPSNSTMSAGAGSTSNGPANDITRNPSSIPAATAAWSAVIITYAMNGVTFIANYDPVASASMTLVSLPSANTIVYGVSHDGHEVLYSVYDGFKTSYYIYPQATTNALFTTPDKSRSAIWSTDDRFLFISTTKGVMSVDVQTHVAQLAFPTLLSVTLLSYREDGYLYYVKGNTGQIYAKEGTFNRINIAQGNSQQITSCVRGSNFWLSPGGDTVYYNCPDQNTSTLYAVRSDGTNSHIFRSNAGSIIGYAEDNSPLTLENTNGKYQVVQRAVNTLQDTVLIQDVAPQAATLMPENVAVAPFGHTLVAKATYGNNGQSTHEQFWFNNLLTGSSHPFSLPQGAISSQVIGWDKLQVSGASLTPTP